MPSGTCLGMGVVTDPLEAAPVIGRWPGMVAGGFSQF